MSASLAPLLAAEPVLRDSHGRSKRKLRISVTDRCNFRCPYCMPDKPRWTPATELLDRQEITALAKLFIREYGIRSIRLTGGEPLLRRDLPALVSELREIPGLQRLSLTSNGVRLAGMASDLRARGLDDVNVSLDALDPERFARLSQGRYGPADVQAGIAAAQDCGLGVKLNAVIIRGYNEAEILPLLDWAQQAGVELRFIEFMPLDDGGLWDRSRVVPSAEILTIIGQRYQPRPLPRHNDPAARYDLGSGVPLGFISTVTEPFCGDCDRLRLTAKGELFSCLFGREGTALRPWLDQPDELDQRIRDTVWRKPPGYISTPGPVERPVRMFQLGG